MKGKKYEDIKERTFKFSVRVIKMVLQLPNNNVATWKIGGQESYGGQANFQ